MRRIVPTWLLLLPLPLAGCIGVPSVAAAISSFTCNAGNGTSLVPMMGTSRSVNPAALDAVFARLDKQPRLEVRQTSCGLAILSLRYIKPNRMQFVAWLNGAGRDPRETQIGNQLGYTGSMYSTRWIGIGVTAHRMLLPDAWRGATSRNQVAATFYLLSPPSPGVRQLSIRVLDRSKQRLFIEQWRGLLYRCPPGAQCPAPNRDPRLFARFTSVLRVDRDTGLPVSLVTVAQSRGRDRGRMVWSRTELVSQAVFRYGGDFSISFVKD